MRPALVRMLIAAIAVLALPATTLHATAAAESPVTVAISEVDLDGPAVSPVTVTVENNGPQSMSKLSVSFAGPIGWTSYPKTQSVKGTIKPGRSVQVQFEIHVPEKPARFTVRTFNSTATYKGGDGNGSATGTRVQRSGTPLASLEAAFNNVGVTEVSNVAPGNFDGDGNSFSAEQLAIEGVTPGSSIDALGTTFTWPTAPPGTLDNAAGGGKTIELAGQGQRLAFLGSGASFAATGTVTVWYTDGTRTTGTIGFPNWSFQEADAHGATLVISMDGRHTPDGYANSEFQYRVFGHSIALDPTKTVEMVTLPGTGSLHIFDVAFVS